MPRRPIVVQLWLAIVLAISLSMAPDFVLSTRADDRSEKKQDSEVGAAIFAKRCALCHGKFGTGDGPLPMIVEGYPETNLLQADVVGRTSLSRIRDYVENGSASRSSRSRMPPWRNELTESELAAVSLFVYKLQTEPETVLEILRRQWQRAKPDPKAGYLIFQSRCWRCHGRSGGGDGPLSPFMEPPPANLQISALNAVAVREIIRKGGAGVGRSPRMPTWGSELTVAELESVAGYVESLRKLGN